MAGVKLNVCEWCQLEQGPGTINERPVQYRQELIFRTVDGKLIFLHLQCEQHYRIKDR
jgi:hypothetical protein